MSALFNYSAVVVRVVDGDTVRLDVDLGFHVWLRDVPVRLAHINAPELSTEAGKLARAYALELLPVGQQVTLCSHSLDKYGRCLGTINIERGLQPFDFGEAMLHADHAVPYEGGPR